jgi:hypothetical protein
VYVGANRYWVAAAGNGVKGRFGLVGDCGYMAWLVVLVGYMVDVAVCYDWKLVGFGWWWGPVVVFGVGW